MTPGTFVRKNIRSSTIATATTCGLLVALAVSSPTAAAQDSSLYDGVEGSLRGATTLGSGESVPGSLDVHQDDFYASLPETIKGKPGEILKTQPSNFALGLPKIDWAGATATRVAYVSSNQEGVPVPVTGTVLTPSAPWKGKGPRPLLTIAPGTQGAGDACAPGKLISFGLEYEAMPVAAALARGWNVALTDLHGLGTAPQHTYMNRVNQAHATLDMARAAVNLNKPGLTAESPVATWGYSQGGGASASALELQPTYAPDVNMKAGYAGGVPADLMMTASAIDSNALAGAIGYTVNGFLYSNPELRPLLDEKLNDRGKEFLEQTADECLPQTLARHAYKDSRDLTKSGKPIREIMEEEPILSVIRKQEIGHIAPKVPVYVGHGTNDDTIPVEQSRRMARMWCEAGTPVNYQEQNIPKVAPLADHMHPMLTHLMPAIDWLERVINGQDYPTTSCGDIPEQDAEPAPFGSSSTGNTAGSTVGSAETAVDTSVAGVPGSLGSSESLRP